MYDALLLCQLPINYILSIFCYIKRFPYRLPQSRIFCAVFSSPAFFFVSHFHVSHFSRFFDASAQEVPSEFLDETYTYPAKTIEGCDYCMVRTQYDPTLTSTFFSDPPVWRTDGQTDGFAIAYSRISRAIKNKGKAEYCLCAFYLCQISWKSDMYFARTHDERIDWRLTYEPTNERTNKLAWWQYLLSDVGLSTCKHHWLG